MAVYRRKYRDRSTGRTVACDVYNYDFIFAGQRYRGSTECTKKTTAKQFEKNMRDRLERALTGLPTEKPESRVRTVTIALTAYEDHYAVDHALKSVALVRERGAHLRRLLGTEIASDLTEERVQKYRKQRLKEKAGTRTIDLELEVLSRAFGMKWSVWWPGLKRLDKGSEAGQVVGPVDKPRILEAAQKSRSPYLYTYLVVSFQTGMRPGEVRMLRWDRFILGTTPDESYVRVGVSKTKGGENRELPMTPLLWSTVVAYRDWYESKLGEIRPEWHVFPFANRRKPVDPSRPATTIKSAWQSLKAKLGVDYRLHDARHTVATATAVANVSEAKRRYLMGHVDEKVIERYTHLRADDVRDDFKRALADDHSAHEVPTVSPTVKAKFKKTSA